MFDFGEFEILSCGGIGEIIMGGLGLITSLIGGSKKQESAPAPTPTPPASPGTEVVDPKKAAEELRKQQAAAQRSSTTTIGTGLGSGSNDSNNTLTNALGGV